jgi:hypothetical protein
MSSNSNTLKISSSTILEDDKNLIIHFYFDGDVAKLSLAGKSEMKRLLNRDIQAVWDVKIPSKKESFLSKVPTRDAKAKVFVEESNDLSKIFWIQRSNAN